MKLLRILTGHHAGAQVILTPGIYRIGTNDDADICLTDWHGEDVLLTMDASGAICAERMEVAPPPEEATELSSDGAEPQQQAAPDCCKTWVIDFEPIKYGDTALCVGWQDAAWPSDLALLSKLLIASGQDAATANYWSRARWRYAKIAGLCVAISGGIAAIGFALTISVSRAAPAPSNAVLEQRLNRALTNARLYDLHVAHVTAKDNAGVPRVIVTGMVRSASDDYIARQIFDRVRPGLVTRHYDIAEETARGIRDAIGVEGVDVKFKGNGVFTVTGTVADKQRINNALGRVRSDFGKSISEIQLELADFGDPASEATKNTFISLVSSEDVRYAQTPDGVKHIYSSPDDAAGASGVELTSSGDDTVVQASH